MMGFHNMKMFHCPICQHPLNSVSDGYGADHEQLEDNPLEMDETSVGICGQCGGVFLHDAEGNPRKPTEEETKRFANDPEVGRMKLLLLDKIRYN